MGMAEVRIATRNNDEMKAAAASTHSGSVPLAASVWLHSNEGRRRPNSSPAFLRNHLMSGRVVFTVFRLDGACRCCFEDFSLLVPFNDQLTHEAARCA